MNDTLAVESTIQEALVYPRAQGVGEIRILLWYGALVDGYAGLGGWASGFGWMGP